MATKASLISPVMRQALGQRIVLVASIVTYVAVFQWMYKNYLYPTWDYFGFHYDPPPGGYLLLAWVLSVTPSLWMPMRLKRPSQLAYWILYITVFIPSMFVPLYAGFSTLEDIAKLMLTLAAGCAIIGGNYKLPLFEWKPLKITRRVFWTGFGCVAIALASWLLLTFHNHLQFLSFNDIYDLRDIQNDVSEGSLVNYAFMLLSGAINPFLMGFGLYSKRVLVFGAGALGQLLVYTVGGTKGSILSIFFLLGFYLLFQMKRLLFAHKLAVGSLALLSTACLSLVWTEYEPGPIHTVALFVVLMRSLSINGLVTAQYYDFFQHNPVTFYSHLKVVDWFVQYPYKYPVGEEIGVAFAGTTNLDATANFWATDGLGGLGLPGVLLMSIFCALVFWALDSAAKKHDPRLAALVSCYGAYNIANISIFTSLLSGGLALVILSLCLMPPETRANLK